MTRASDTSAVEVGDIPEELAKDFDGLVNNKVTFGEFRDRMANVLYQDASLAVTLLGWLCEQQRLGRLPSHLHDTLDADIRRISNEDVPTVVDAAPAMLEEPPPAAKPVSKDPGVASVLRSAHRLAIGDVLCERYEIVGRAHGGNMSSVYKAHDIPTGNDVAVKLLRPESSSSGRAVRALQDEFEKGRACRHPNIVRYIALERHEDVFFVVMEWLDGEHLAERINREPGVGQDFDWTFEIVERLASALNAIHDCGYVHADVKPGNVMLLTDGSVRLFDFGVAQAFGQLARERVAFDAGVLAAATPAYSSAAVLDGKPATPTDDLYSLATLTYRLLAGKRPYAELTALKARERGVTPPRIDSLSPAAWSVLDSALGHDPDQRPSSVDAFVEGIRTPVAPPDSQRSRGAVVWLGATAIVLAAAVAAVVGFNRWGPQPAEIDGSASTVAAPATGAGRVLERETRAPETVEGSGVPSVDAPDVAAEPSMADADGAADVPSGGLADPAATDDTAAAVVGDSGDVELVDTGSDVAVVDGGDVEAVDSSPAPPGPSSASTAANDAPVATGNAASPADTTDLIMLPLDGPATTLTLVETDPTVTLRFEASTLDVSEVGVYLNALTRDQYKQTLSLLDAGIVPISDGIVEVRLQPRASWRAAPTREYRLYVMTTDRSRVLANIPVRVLDQDAPTEPPVETLPTPATAPPVPPAAVPAPAVTVQFATSLIAVAENDRVVRVPLVVADDAPSSVRIEVQAGSAEPDEDFIQPRQEDLLIDLTQSDPSVLISLVNDSDPETVESFGLRIVSAGPDAATSTVRVMIRDDD
ncbi:MAG: serine/threonine-protein kinase [Pseudomonadota bacterium]